MRLKFLKMHGCGNDFLFLDYLGSEPVKIYPSEVVYLCNRHFGIGADGLVILHDSPVPDAMAGWTFFNCDGSEASMCGNAARCAIRYLADKHFQTDDVISIHTKAGIVKGRRLEDSTLIELALFHKGEKPFKYDEVVLEVEGHMFNAYLIFTGVPHAVIEVRDIVTYPISRVGSLLVNHPQFEPDGSNITFYQKLVGSKIKATTFERGVLTQTFACGTGTAAAAIIYTDLYMQPMPIEVAVPGGDIFVDISPASKMVLLRGKAEYICTFEVDEIPQAFEHPTLYGK